MSTGLDFTTLARVRALLGFKEGDTEKDADLSRLISSVSADMENEMRRFVRLQAYDEILPFWPPARSMRVSGAPVLDTPAPILEVSNTRDFVSNSITLNRGIDFVLENDTGLIRFLVALRPMKDPVSGWIEHPTYARIRYTGGFAATQAALEIAQPQLCKACELQVCYLFKRQDSPGGNIVTGPSSSNFEQPLNWLPFVARTMDYLKKRGIY